MEREKDIEDEELNPSKGSGRKSSGKERKRRKVNRHFPLF